MIHKKWLSENLFSSEKIPGKILLKDLSQLINLDNALFNQYL